MTLTIERDELKAKLESGDDFILVETLPEEAFAHVHLPKAINLPPDRVAELAENILPDKSAEIIVYCTDAGCYASVKAARELAAIGYMNVRDYEAGKEDWIDAGLPVETFPKHREE